jgi:hypothetical protein
MPATRWRRAIPCGLPVLRGNNALRAARRRPAPAPAARRRDRRRADGDARRRGRHRSGWWVATHNCRRPVIRERRLAATSPGCRDAGKTPGTGLC